MRTYETLMSAGAKLINIASVVAIGCCGVAWTRQYYAAAHTLKQGARFASIDLPTERRTLVMALSTTCPYCTASAPFYRDLVRSISEHGSVYTVAVFPQSKEDSGVYLRTMDLPLLDRRQVNFADLSIDSTPTLILIKNLRVEKVWVGKLSAELETEVFRTLGLPRLPPVSSRSAAPRSEGDAPAIVTATSLATMLQSSVPPVLVDIRPRDEYGAGHLERAVNIPLDELEVRASHELPRSRELVLYCRIRGTCLSPPTATDISAHCRVAAQLLFASNLGPVSMIRDDLSTLQAAGFSVVGREHRPSFHARDVAPY